jgi:thiol-disulfide isomerase/thioredoxin
MNSARGRYFVPMVVWISIGAITFTLSLCGALAQNPGKQKRPATQAPGAPGIARRIDSDNPIVQLARDPAVQKELGISRAQIVALDSAYAKVEPRLFLLRDAGAATGAQEKAQLLASMETELETILDAPQCARLRQLVVRARGWPGITVEPAAAQLKLSAEQIEQIETITQKAVREIQRIGASGDSPTARSDAIAKSRAEEGTSIQKLLSAEQRRTLSELVGAPFDLSQVQPLAFQAPEFREVDAWINSAPLKLSDLRGKVVAFHFWAFNCGNCINNLPHYTKWHEQFASGGLVVVGMHTPETAAERNVDTLRSKLDEHAIRYPVAVDHQTGNWSAWANSMWPSVYLVDKLGRVRYWWYGEMNWQGIEGEKFMRQKIENLLAE